jgi:small subunit ribosomal protein S17
MKIFKGQVIKSKMKDTVVVAVSRRTPHPLYKKLIKRTSKFKVSAPGNTVSVGDTVSIVETRPIAKGVHFKLMEEKAVKGDKK